MTEKCDPDHCSYLWLTTFSPEADERCAIRMSGLQHGQCVETSLDVAARMRASLGLACVGTDFTDDVMDPGFGALFQPKIERLVSIE
tara:strand:+ start:250 stop:510 length:261 start_codon:yes stop_codon:yes gene_type:complete